jgi:RNA-directed DNA polymerase
VIRKLNPIIRGWANYYRTQVSSEVFSALDQHLWRLTWKWARFSHQDKSKSWVAARYFGQFNKSRQDRWVFGDRKSGAYMHKFSWTRIVRHHLGGLVDRQRCSAPSPGPVVGQRGVVG